VARKRSSELAKSFTGLSADSTGRVSVDVTSIGSFLQDVSEKAASNKQAQAGNVRFDEGN
jgi:hypothetical protein